jgi:acyl-CoA thioester hydrolase
VTSDQPEKNGGQGSQGEIATSVRANARRPSDPSPVTRDRSAIASSSFSFPIRVYWEDTDAGGIVYYANYLKFMERARSEWLRAIGVEQGPLKDEHNAMFVVVNVEAHFKRPARYGELLQVGCVIDQTTRASLTFKQQIFRESDLLIDGKVRVACLDATTFRPQPVPDTVVEKMQAWRSR